LFQSDIRLSHQSLHLAVTNLDCRRGGRRVFSAVSFTLGPGEMLTLTGRNGAGKSSLLGMLAGRIAIDGGVIALDSPEDSTLAEISHHIGHRDALKATLTAGENLDFARALLGEPYLSAGDALAEVGLGHATAIPVGYLSAGQRRRVALARLLVSKRPLWLLDEPTAALDTVAQAMLTGLMRAHLSDGGLIIAATHAPLGLDGARELRLGTPA
jgi:heme exporter protein A